MQGINLFLLFEQLESPTQFGPFKGLSLDLPSLAQFCIRVLCNYPLLPSENSSGHIGGHEIAKDRTEYSAHCGLENPNARASL